MALKLNSQCNQYRSILNTNFWNFHSHICCEYKYLAVSMCVALDLFCHFVLLCSIKQPISIKIPIVSAFPFICRRLLREIILDTFVLAHRCFMMTSSNGNIFRVTGPLVGEFIGHPCIPQASDADLWCFLWSTPWINRWVNNREAGDLRRHRAHYGVIVIYTKCLTFYRYVLSLKTN